MKIAVASTGSHVARHFALCESFHIYMVYGGKIMKETDIPNPGLRPAMLPEFLEKLEKAGLSDVIKEKQAQFDAWRGAQ